jgi:hypothetical protein
MPGILARARPLTLTVLLLLAVAVVTAVVLARQGVVHVPLLMHVHGGPAGKIAMHVHGHHPG